MKKVDVELKKIYLKDGTHVGYMLNKVSFDGESIDISKAPLFKTQVEANNFLRNMQEELNKKFSHPFDKIKEPNLGSVFESLFGDLDFMKNKK